MDILVELFTPDNSTTVMKLCNPEVTHVGSTITSNVNGTAQTMAEMNQRIKKEGKTPDTKDVRYSFLLNVFTQIRWIVIFLFLDNSLYPNTGQIS